MKLKSMSIIKIFINITFTILCSWSTEIPRCEKGCCSNYKWNIKTEKCEKCLPGYKGIDCSQSCPYPSYGVGCQLECDCERHLCDVSTGCRDVTTALVGRTISSISDVTDSSLIDNNTVSVSEASTDVLVRGSQTSCVNDFLLVLIKTLGCVDILLMCAHVVVYIHDRRNRTDTNGTDTTVNYHRTSTMYENVDINFPSTLDV